MPRNQSLMPYMAFLSGILMCLVASCGNGPKVRVYLSDPGSGGMEYYDENTGERGFVSYADTDKFIAFSQADATTLFNYCGLGK
jgi:hypothetical protein